MTQDGGFFNRKEPKSLDYYLYQTRSNSISGTFDDHKRSSKSSFKQEASTGGSASAASAASLGLILTGAAYFFSDQGPML